MVRIQVVYNGRPVKSIEVHVSWGAFTHSRGRTDSNGYVEFDVTPGRGKIILEGKVVYEGDIRGTVVVEREF